MKPINIKKVTPELTKRATKFGQQMIEQYLSTESTPKTEKEAERNILKFYKLAKFDMPQKIVWVNSAFNKNYLSAVRSAVRSAVYSAVRSAVYGTTHSLGWSSWMSWYEFYNKNWKKNDVHSIARFTQLTNGAVVVKDTLYIFRKPEILKRDEDGRLHSEQGMAYRFRDGNGFYFYHGVKVDQKVIDTPEKLTKKDWLNESNLEVRRVIQERMPDFVQKIGAKKIDKSDRGILLEVDLGSDPEKIARYVQVKDSSTAREYFLRVPPTVNEVDEAVAWTFGLDAGVYKPTQEA